jgi:hypothetical protein
MNDTDCGASLMEQAEPLPYIAPRLHTFGLLADITRRVGTTGLLADKSGGGTNKTM